MVDCSCMHENESSTNEDNLLSDEQGNVHDLFSGAQNLVAIQGRRNLQNLFDFSVLCFAVSRTFFWSLLFLKNQKLLTIFSFCIRARLLLNPPLMCCKFDEKQDRKIDELHCLLKRFLIINADFIMVIETPIRKCTQGTPHWMDFIQWSEMVVAATVEI